MIIAYMKYVSQLVNFVFVVASSEGVLAIVQLEYELFDFQPPVPFPSCPGNSASHEYSSVKSAELNRVFVCGKKQVIAQLKEMRRASR